MKKKSQGLPSAFAEGYGLGIKFFTILACPILSGAVCGIWLDRLLMTKPWMMFLLLILSFVFAMYAVYRVASRLQEEASNH
ncbi:MAG: AtpZ/AtpI family protein [Anaerolineae bacterium]|nr:AtpZ/AtpI family protein [Anaerolineae bacterium]